MWSLPILRKREGRSLQCGVGEVVHVVGHALGYWSSRSTMRVDERSAGEGPNSKEMPDLVEALTGWLGEYQKRPDRQRQDHVERRELFQLAGHLLGSSTGSHRAGFPVAGGHDPCSILNFVRPADCIPGQTLRSSLIGTDGRPHTPSRSGPYV